MYLKYLHLQNVTELVKTINHVEPGVYVLKVSFLYTSFIII